ncbi:MAG: hydrolase [Oscillospiraceae bacterium]
MTKLPMDRAGAWALLCAHTRTESLRKHALCVEGAMRYFARLYGEDVEWWGMVGLLHDLDFEEHPEQHCQITPVLLREAGFPEDFVRAVLTHGWGLCTEVEPTLPMEKVIYAADELTGFVTACALVRPSKSVMDLEPKSVKKKFKDAAFAAKVRRDVIQAGADRMGMPLDELIGHVILALREISDEIGFGLTHGA